MRNVSTQSVKESEVSQGLFMNVLTRLVINFANLLHLDNLTSDNLNILLCILDRFIRHRKPECLRIQVFYYSVVLLEALGMFIEKSGC